jgi:hypothetical protein
MLKIEQMQIVIQKSILIKHFKKTLQLEIFGWVPAWFLAKLGPCFGVLKGKQE